MNGVVLAYKAVRAYPGEAWQCPDFHSGFIGPADQLLIPGKAPIRMSLSYQLGHRTVAHEDTPGVMCYDFASRAISAAVAWESLCRYSKCRSAVVAGILEQPRHEMKLASAIDWPGAIINWSYEGGQAYSSSEGVVTGVAFTPLWVVWGYRRGEGYE